VALTNPGTSPSDAARKVWRQRRPARAERGRTASPAPAGNAGHHHRRSWGADERLRSYNGAACAKPNYSRTIQAAFVHPHGRSHDYTRAQVPAMVRATYAYHVKGRGWCDIGYNFLVDRFGRIFEGRYGGMQFPVLGAHTGGYNTDSFGISLIGNFQLVVPTAAMMEAAARTIA